MSSKALEWLVFFVFIFLAAGLTFAEAFVIYKKNWASFGKALAFAVVTNFIGFCAGFFVLLVAALIILMFVFEQRVDNTNWQELGIWAVIISGILFFPLFLALCKRLFMKILKIQTGIKAWIFSFASAVLIVFLSFGISILVGYFIF